MKRLKISTIIKLLFLTPVVFILTSLSRDAQNSLNSSQFNSISGYKFDNFPKKSYYTKIFSSKEIKALKKTEKSYIKAEKLLKKADATFAEVENNNKIIELSKREVDRKNALKNAEKLQKEAFKKGIAAMECFNKANSEKFSIYALRLKSMKDDGTPEHKEASDLASEAVQLFSQSKVMFKNIENLSSEQKYSVLKQIYEMQTEVVHNQEVAFGFYMHDTELKIENKKTVNLDTNDIIKKDTTKVTIEILGNDTIKVVENIEENNNLKTDTNKIDNIKKYQIENDKNLYISKSDILFSKILLNQREKDSYTILKQSVETANNLLEQVDNEYIEIDKLIESAAIEPDKKTKENIKQEAATKEKNSVLKMIQAANLYLNANKSLYEIYENHLDSVRIKGNKKGLEYEKSADELFIRTESTVVSANLQSFRHEQYLQLMNGNRILLAGIQQQENAYCVYFKLPETPLSSDVQVIVNEIITDKNIKTNDKNTKTDKNKTEKLNFKGTYVYSEKNPKPELLKQKKGVYFKVQAGAYKKLLDIKKYSIFETIEYDEFTNTQIKRFALGEYQTTEGAELALQKAKEFGHSDASIFSVINNKKGTYSQGKALLKKDAKYKQNVKNELEILNKNKEVVTENIKKDDNKNNSNKVFKKDVVIEDDKKDVIKENKKNDDKKIDIVYGTEKYDFAKGTDIKTTKGLVYCVQIGVYKLPKTNFELKQVTPLFEEQFEDTKKYLVGNFSTYEKAVEQREELVKKGIPNAYIVAYLDGKSIELSKVGNSKKDDNIVKKDSKKTEEIIFKVQIGAYAAKLPKNKESQFSKLGKKYPITFKTDDTGLVIYTVGNLKTYSEAVELKNAIKKEASIEGFIIAYKNELKINVTEAINLIEK